MKNLSILFVFLTVIPFSYSQNIEEKLEEVKYRNIGPFRGGRSVSSVGVINDPLTYYMGTAGGGLWKTTNAGSEWFNISDDYFKTSSVGAIAVSESDSRIIYVGMGEHSPRGVTTSYGDGVYKSTDAGKTWEHMGLENSQQISRIIIHPDNNNIIYVAAQGAINGPTKERGVYKSTDGGRSWKNVLYVNELSGASELSIDYNNPNVLYATIWEHQRLPWKVISGGEGSGVYKSTDGGDNWFKIENGLPNELGKLAISVSRANSDKVYLLAESDSNKRLGGLFVSNNAGESWTRISKYAELTSRSWYYIEVFADPNDENTVYVLSARAFRSIDGGKTWERIYSGHGDYHDLWINPDDPSNMLISNDGGSEISFDAGKNWSRIDNMPTGQFYRLITDNLFPYNIYGGQQDNSSIKISSIGIGSSGIGSKNWSASAGGESAFIAFDPDNPNRVMGGSYLGSIEILDVKSKLSTNIKIEPNLYMGLAARDMKYLFNWNAPIIKSIHEPNTYFHGAQYLLKTIDEGISWKKISPDLTRNQNDKQGKGGGPYTVEAVGAENYGTLSYVAESPHESGVIYTASDDGLIHVTKNNGDSWKNITSKKLDETLINSVEISPHSKEVTYIATTRYKFNDFKPSIYKLSNYGMVWKNISDGIGDTDFTRVIREDPLKKGMLYLGTQNGLYISWNDGDDWSKLNLNFPVVPITDLKIKNDNLIIATHGRAFWILDDLNILREYNKIKNIGQLFKPSKTIIPNWYSSMNENNSKGTDLLEGINPASGMVLYYTLPKLSDKTEIKIEIFDSGGDLVNVFSSLGDSEFIKYDGGPKKKTTLTKNIGLNRFVWNMRHNKLKGIPNVYIEGSYEGHQAIPGEYKVVLSYLDKELFIDCEIIENPLFSLSNSEYESYHNFMTEAEKIYNEMTNLTNKYQVIKNEMVDFKSKINPSKEKNILNEINSILNEIVKWDKIMVQRLSKAYDDVENFENGFTAHYLHLLNQVDSGIPKLTKGSKMKLIELNKQWKVYKKSAKRLIDSKINEFNIKYKKG